MNIRWQSEYEKYLDNFEPDEDQPEPKDFDEWKNDCLEWMAEGMG
jgi:hypothetical protein